jgi:hypothetical protein
MKYSLFSLVKNEFKKLYSVWEDRLVQTVMNMKKEDDYRLAGLYHDLNRCKNQIILYLEYAEEIKNFEWDAWENHRAELLQDNYKHGYGI